MNNRSLIYEKKPIKILINYLNEYFSNISPKKLIILLDNNYCIPKDKNQLYNIYQDSIKYLFFIHENPISQYIKIKENFYQKENNALIITDRRKQLLKSFYYSEIKINPKILLEYYFGKKFGKKIILPNNINDLSYLIWKSIDFIEENIERYKNQLENKHFVEIIFRELLKDNLEPIYIIKKLLLSPELIIEIHKNSFLENLKKSINIYISNLFPRNFCKIIEKCIINDNCKDLFNLLFIISYIKQFNKDLNNFETAFKYINLKENLVPSLDLNEDIIPLNDKIKEISVIADNFILKILSESERSKNSFVKSLGNFIKIIKTIESNINLFELNPITKKLIFFPELDDISKDFNKILFDIPHFWLSFNFLEYYISAILRIFFRNPKLKELTNAMAQFTALNYKAIDIFKENIFYKIEGKNSEYWIKLNFLENFVDIILYLFYLKKEIIPMINNRKDDHLIWKSIFEKYIVRLNDSIELFIENKLQFIPSTTSNVEYLVKDFDLIIFDILNEINLIFKEYLLKNYSTWVSNTNDMSTPLNVVNVLRRKFFPNYKTRLNSFNLFLFIDCCHLGIWNLLKQKILNDFTNLNIHTELGFSILPTITKYARLALFSGEYPINIQSFDELKEFLRQVGKPISRAYVEKMKNFFITNCENMFDFRENIENIKRSKDNFQISIFNFSDRTSHTYSQNFLKTLISSIYNSKIRPLIELIVRSYDKIFIFFATDHGCSRCTEIFDWESDKFNRYWENDIFHKRGARTFISYEKPININVLSKNLICLKDGEPLNWGLKNFYDGKELSYFFATNYYNLKKTPENKHNLENFGHGGASMDEFIIPFAIIKKKNKNSDDFNWKLDINFTIQESTSNKHVYKILIRNNSNREIIFNEGHLITEYLHHKFILHKNCRIYNSFENNKREIKFRFPNKYFQKNACFYFSFYQDEKLETTDIIYA